MLKEKQSPNCTILIGDIIKTDTPSSFKIGELFKMDYSAVSQAAKRFEQKTEVDNEIKEYMQKVITVLKEI